MRGHPGDEDNIDFRGITAKAINRIQARELVHDDIFSETMLNNILGGFGLYDMSGNQVELLRVNEQYCKITGTSAWSWKSGIKML